MLTYEELKRNESVKAYIEGADKSLAALGFTEHSFAHVGKVADTCRYILSVMGFTRSKHQRKVDWRSCLSLSQLQSSRH